MKSSTSRGGALLPLCLLLQLSACGNASPTAKEPTTAASRSQALIAINCQPPTNSIPYCPPGWAGCGSQGGLKPLCCFDDAFGASCRTDPNGNVVVCQPGEVRCGMSCAVDLTTANCSDPVLQGHCNLLYPSSGLCWGNCYDTTTSYCQVTASCGQCVYSHSQPMGGSCHTDLECSKGKCSNLACGLGGECVCDTDADCGAGNWCDQGTLGIGKNTCKSLKSLGDVCTRGAQCSSNCCKLHIASNPFSPVCRPADKC